MHGKISTIEKKRNPIFNRLPEKFNVVRYHSLVCDRIPTMLKTIAESAEKEVMALAHESLPLWGLQFHPEAVLTSCGLQMLRNWVKLNFIKN
jgi:anthranilate synthase component 2